MQEKDKRERREKPKKKRPKTMDVILIIVGVSLLLFTLEMINLYKIYGGVPDTLVSCVFACLGGECGIMGWIKTTKDKHTDRQWQLDDEKRRQDEMNRASAEPHEEQAQVQEDDPSDGAAG